MKVLETHPGPSRDLFLQYDKIASYLAREAMKHASPAPTVLGLEYFGPLPQWDRQKTTLILWGEAGTGKTSLAKSLIPTALFLNHLDKLKDFNPGIHGGIIFDDMSFLHRPREDHIAITDVENDRQIHIRYKIAEIPAFTAKIMTTNKRPHEILLTYDAAILRRITMWQMVNFQTVLLYEQSEHQTMF